MWITDVRWRLPLGQFLELLGNVHMSIIKGNAGEIGALAGSTEVRARGVDSVGSGFKDPAKIVRDLARRDSKLTFMSLTKPFLRSLTLLVLQSSSWPCLAKSTTSPTERRLTRSKMDITTNQSSRGVGAWQQRKSSLPCFRREPLFLILRRSPTLNRSIATFAAVSGEAGPLVAAIAG